MAKIRPRGLYVTDDGTPVMTHSMARAFRRCPQQANYKYVRRLKPKLPGGPLKRGTWVHKLLEVKYKGGDWRAEHQRLSTQFAGMLDEERDFYGDMPREIKKIMRGYEWHYKNHDWKVHDAEFILEAPLPDGTIYRAKIDLLVEDQYGLWLVDHKSHKRLPTLDYRILDAQSADYVWVALKNKIPIQGHIWNYLRWKPPTFPQLVYVGKPNERLSTRSIETDYPTFISALRQYNLDPKNYKDQLRRYKGQQYVHGEMQTSPFFRRDILEKKAAMVNRVAAELYHTAQRANSYDFTYAERVVDRSCTYMCDYTDICTLELFTGRELKKGEGVMKNYTIGDPMDYYNDADSKWDRRGDGD